MQLHEELYKYKSRFTEKNGSNTKKHGSASINRAVYKIFKVSDKDVICHIRQISEQDWFVETCCLAFSGSSVQFFIVQSFSRLV